MNLLVQLNRLNTRLDLVENRFTDFRKSMPLRLDHKDWMFLEGLISATWQYWCHFCRTVVIHSTLGAKTATGNILPARAGSWQEVSAAAIQAAKKKKVVQGELNTALRYEPTWGDPKKLLNIITGLTPGNQQQLIQSFGASSYISHIQIVRNAAAHRHYQNTAEIIALGPFYVVSRLRHPTEALLWLEQSSKNFAFLFWLDDMRMIGNLAVQ